MASQIKDEALHSWAEKVLPNMGASFYFLGKNRQGVWFVFKNGARKFEYHPDSTSARKPAQEGVKG